MKKILLFAFICMMSAMAAAQSLYGLEVKGSYGTETERYGVGIGMTLGIIGDLQLCPSFNYFFEKDDVMLFDVDADLHYNFHLGKSVILYPLIGATYYNIRYESDALKEVEGKFGANFGGGIGVYLLKELMVKAELKYQVVEKPDDELNETLFHYKDQLKASIGIAYMF